MFDTLKKWMGAIDMTEGKPISKLMMFAVPLLIGNLVQQLYSTVDAIVVGRYVGDVALAAVGAAMPAVGLVTVLFMGVSVGSSIMVAQYFGAKDGAELAKAIGNCLTIALICALLMTGVGVLISRPLLTLLNTPPDVLEAANTYMVISFGFMIGIVFYNIVSGMLRGMGDSVMPLLFLIVACVTNIVLDIVFVAGCKWGVAGVAWATVISQTVSAVLCVIRLLRMRDVVTLHWSDCRLRKRLVWQMLRLGVPSGATQAIFSIAQLVVQSLTNSLGTSVIACTTVVMRVDGFAMMPNFTFGTAMTTFAGQNIGAGRLDRVERGTKDGLRLALIVSVVMTGAILIFGEYLMRAFTTTDEVVRLGMRMLRIISVGYVGMAITQSLSGVMRGAGDAVGPMWISIITTVVLRVPVAYLWAWLTRSPELPNGSSDSLFFSLLISWVVGALLTIAWYKWGNWRKKGLIQRDVQRAVQETV